MYTVLHVNPTHSKSPASTFTRHIGTIVLINFDSSKNSIAVIKEKIKHKIKKNKRANKQQVTGIRCIANCPALC